MVALSNNSGSIGEGYIYDAFGKCTVITSGGTDGSWLTDDGTSDTKSAYGNPYQFTARRYDNETGLYYYRTRMYKPDLGRFLQPDPIGYDDGMNMYAYVGNNSVNLIDPSGLKIEFSDDVSWIDKRAYNKAVKELSKTALFRNTYEYLSREDTPLVMIGIGTSSDSGHFWDGSSSSIFWNKKDRMKTYKGKQPAFMSLAHEMEHARIAMIGGITAPRDKTV